MTYDQLEMLEAIIDTGSFKAAGEKLSKTQPSISAGIKKIEDAYAIKLFSRDSYKPVLTDVGERFFEHAKQALASFRDLESVAKTLGTGREPQINIAVDPLAELADLTFLKTLAADLDVTTINFDVQVFEDNYDAIINKTHDIAIGPRPTKDDRLEVKAFTTIKMKPVISRHLIGKAIDSKDVLDTIPHIVIKSKYDVPNVTTMNTKKRWMVSGRQFKERLIIEGVGWGHLPEDVIKKYDHLHVIPKRIVPRADIELYFLRNPYHSLGVVGKRLWDSV